MEKMNKKAWLRIVEAVIAILIVMGVILIISYRNVAEPNIEESIYQKQEHIINIITSDENLRNDILQGNNINVDNYIKEKDLIPSNWEFATAICEVNQICSPTSPELPTDKQIYVEERIVTSTLTSYSPKKIKFFVWMK